MINITVNVPEERVAEFYSMFGAWLAKTPGQEEVSGVDDEGHAPWTADDLDLATQVWAKFSDVAKGLFSILIDSPETYFSGEELAERLEIEKGKHGVAGVLAWPGRHCFAVNRARPWRWYYPVEGEPAVYWFTKDMADLFGRARGN